MQQSECSEQKIIHKIRKADMVLIIGFLLSALLMEVFFIFPSDPVSEIRFLCDGTEIRRITLQSADRAYDGAADGYYLITYPDDTVKVEFFASGPDAPTAEHITEDMDEGTGYNLVVVEDGKVSVAASDCPDQICVKHRPISLARESIVCLPHKLVIEMAEGADGTDDGALDGVAR